ncbi:GEVED domain-containing protein [Flavobacterium subsaxonicum]|uniref:GEVED domain-containing protein n=1 Tax=Flavobacterium subsaxonicum WB 4.1-42 = DSM 21790 TaxID=1121898 RepID=A0A0A2MTL5_9FLAO|nr:GEVED domain-containing protein [Flavobacterium subsaxonicum]KGO91575.1 hypothetical protein Q766_17040 [Flavobacterium subsaxonicum WB 4.1-42 = DSM 21790]
MKLKQLFLSLGVALVATAASAQVKIGANPTTINSTAELEIESTTKGFLPPRLTTAQRDAIVSPAEGLTIYNTTTKCLNWYDGLAWFSPCEAATPEPEPEPLTFCNITVQWQVYPISSVTFAGIANTSASATSTDLTLANQDFTTIEGNVTKGQSYPITLKGNTGSWAPQVCKFTVFIDFNHNGVLNDAGEVFEAGSIQGSNGTDAVQAVTNIAIPATALTGETRMRVIYNTTDFALDPCATYSWAQAENYTLNVAN